MHLWAIMDVKITENQRFSTIDTRKALESWFLEHHTDNPERLRQSRIWQVIKKYTDKMGHYKAKKRGKPDYSIKDKLTRRANNEV